MHHERETRRIREQMQPPYSPTFVPSPPPSSHPTSSAWRSQSDQDRYRTPPQVGLSSRPATKEADVGDVVLGYTLFWVIPPVVMGVCSAVYRGGQAISGWCTAHREAISGAIQTGADIAARVGATVLSLAGAATSVALLVRGSRALARRGPSDALADVYYPRVPSAAVLEARPELRAARNGFLGSVAAAVLAGVVAEGLARNPAEVAPAQADLRQAVLPPPPPSASEASARRWSAGDRESTVSFREVVEVGAIGTPFSRVEMSLSFFVAERNRELLISRMREAMASHLIDFRGAPPLDPMVIVKELLSATMRKYPWASGIDTHTQQKVSHALNARLAELRLDGIVEIPKVEFDIH